MDPQTLFLLMLITLAILFLCIFAMFISIHSVLKRQYDVMMLIIEAFGKLTRAEKSCLLYLQKIEQELKSQRQTEN